MSARDDYSGVLDWASGGWGPMPHEDGQLQAMFNEIDLLRSDVSRLLAMLADSNAEWPNVS